MKKLGVLCLLSLLIAAGTIANEASAATKVMWGKTELKRGQIGKVTILSDTKLVKIENRSISVIRTLKKGEEYRVYNYKNEHNGLYGVGGGSFVQKTIEVKYETPSKKKLALLDRMSVPVYNAFDGDEVPVAGTKVSEEGLMDQ
ncbi:hypothetical protein FZD47_20365 [Bacillus infantis]|uniref:DUF3221 domain-containing protein n=1 Tax=Bacillus infantis TaxID=324767 RepID=A0A5D4SA94_9BACI|nr:hypothetical protein [Bacillus infantis]TYS60567.1 hypothetical protein FZD47_20365 [Bacillus infantis]